MHVLCLALPTLIRSKLICSGFSTTEDFLGILDTNKLKTLLNVTPEDASLILNVVGPYIKNGTSSKPVNDTCGVTQQAQLSDSVLFKSVSQLLKTRLQHVRHIVSFSYEVDRLLGGGFPLGRLTEIAGQAGLGKTQFCFQLCVDVQMPSCFGGTAGEAVFLDVEGTFFPQRVEQMAKAAVRHCRHIADNSGCENCIDSIKEFTVENIMSHIYLFQCRNSVQLLAAAHQMKEFLRTHPRVKLLVVDSVAQCFRGEDDFRTRSKFLSTLGRILLNIAEDFDLAIVLTNQVSAKFGDEGSKCDIPALGEKWGHTTSFKLMLHKQNTLRFLYQYKSPGLRDGIVEYCVTEHGIRDPDYKNIGKMEWSDKHNSEASLTGVQNDCHLYFCPTPTMFSERKEDDLEASSIQFSEESISNKWIELSQKQLHNTPVFDRDGEESTVASPIPKGSEGKKDQTCTLKSSKEVCEKVGTALQRTVEAMLSCERSVKAAPSRKRQRIAHGDGDVDMDSRKRAAGNSGRVLPWE